MKRGRILVVVFLLVIASMMAAVGSGALNSFTAPRDFKGDIVGDAEGFIAITSNSSWAQVYGNEQLYLDFSATNPVATGVGFNKNSVSISKDVFRITNNGTKPVYVWLESPNFPNSAWMLTYRVNTTNTTGDVTAPSVYTYRDMGVLLGYPASNFVNGVGQEAYAYLAVGETLSVDIYSNLDAGYPSNQAYDTNLNHTVIVRANDTAPTR